MPAIWLFPRSAEEPRAKELLAFAADEVGVTARFYEDAAEDDDSTAYVFSVVEDEEEAGSARIECCPRTSRDEERQEMIDEIVGQAPDLKDELDRNGLDMIVSFDATEEDLLAGCVAAYAIASLGNCGLLITGLDEFEELAAEEAGYEPHEHDENCSHTRYYTNAEDFAEDFFGDDEDMTEGEEDDEEEGDSPKS